MILEKPSGQLIGHFSYKKVHRRNKMNKFHIPYWFHFKSPPLKKRIPPHRTPFSTVDCAKSQHFSQKSTTPNGGTLHFHTGMPPFLVCPIALSSQTQRMMQIRPLHPSLIMRSMVSRILSRASTGILLSLL